MVVERTRYLELTRDVAVLANRAESVPEALSGALDLICDHNDWSFCHAYLLEDPARPSSGLIFQPVTQERLAPEARHRLGELARERVQHGLVRQAFESGDVQWCDGIGETSLAGLEAAEAEELGAGAAYVFPIVQGKDVVGVLEFFSREGGEPEEALCQAMVGIGGLIARVIERQRLQREVTLAVWREQQDAGRRVHDTLSQGLTGLSLLAGSLEKKLSASGRPEAALAGELVEAASQVHHQVRDLSRGLYVSEVADGPQGLSDALDRLCLETSRRFRSGCLYDSDGEVPVHDRETSIQLFFIAREALTNALRHAAPGEVRVSLQRRDGAVVLRVEDDGSGFVDTDEGGLGIDIMRYRSNMIGGELEIRSEKGGGTRVTCSVPLKPADDSTQEIPE